MPIQFQCPLCGKQSMVADQYAGRSGPCSACGGMITVPGLGAAPVASKSSSKTLLIVVVASAISLFLMCAGVLAAILLPAAQKAREAAIRTQCRGNLMQLGLAMHNYEGVYGSLPPVFTVDENGKPLHSWRTLLLPYLGEGMMHDTMDMKQPWDSPKNQVFANKMPKVFRCPSSQANLGKPFTSYVVLTGQSTLFESKENGKGWNFKDVTDGLSNTIMIVEVEGLDIPWMKPQDIDVTEFVRGEILKGKGHENHVGGLNASMADGSVKFFRLNISPEDRKALSTRAGGEVINPSDL